MVNIVLFYTQSENSLAFILLKGDFITVTCVFFAGTPPADCESYTLSPILSFDKRMVR